jgi:HlyD family secretion protein
MQASLAQARVRLADLGPTAPVDALVENTFYDTGEYVQAGQPVVSLLSPEKIKLRFFVPESDIARARHGATIAYRCDGCAPDQHATIIYVAPRAEYTPPVIYSEAARQKLVFLVEAKPTGPAPALRPGLPVEVAPLAP